MRKYIFILLCNVSQAQAPVLFYGNHESICYTDRAIRIERRDTLPTGLENYQAIFLFSSVTSVLKEQDIVAIESFVREGGGLYIGAENPPFQEECERLLERMFQLNHWSPVENGDIEITPGSFLDGFGDFSSGVTPVVFPLHPLLNVDVWLGDEALVLSGSLGKGKLIIDGGYSRFFCPSNQDQILQACLKYLRKNKL